MNATPMRVRHSTAIAAYVLVAGLCSITMLQPRGWVWIGVGIVAGALLGLLSALSGPAEQWVLDFARVFVLLGALRLAEAYLTNEPAPLVGGIAAVAVGAQLAARLDGVIRRVMNRRVSRGPTSA